MSTAQRYWRETPQRYRLQAALCTKCGFIAYPPRAICPECKNREFETKNLSNRGKLLTYTVIHVPPPQFRDDTPYAVGIVETEEGVRLTVGIADVESDELKIGMPVKLEFRMIQKDGDEGILCYGHKAVVE
ncbi:MAG: Zn-ribbon domain-containing OB-fold protein [Candidatus Glassbacteria bacterium]